MTSIEAMLVALMSIIDAAPQTGFYGKVFSKYAAEFYIYIYIYIYVFIIARIEVLRTFS